MSQDEAINENRFVRGEEKTADLVERVSLIEGQIVRINDDLYGSGRESFPTRMIAFISAYEAREEVREKSDMRWRWFAGIVLSILAILVSAFLTLWVHRQIQSGLLHVENGRIMAQTQTSDWRH